MCIRDRYVPLSPAQQQLYDSQYGGRNAVEEEPQEAPAQEQTQAVRSAESKEKADLDIHVKPMDMGPVSYTHLVREMVFREESCDWKASRDFHHSLRR